MSYDYSQPAGIRVITRFTPVAFLLYLCTPRLHLDGGPAVPLKWGVTDIPVSPGRHQVRCYFPYLFYKAVGDSSIIVDVAPGQLVTVRWKAPWLVFLSGKWSTQSVQPLGVQPVGMQPVGMQLVDTHPVGMQPVGVPAPGPAPLPGPPAAAWHPDPAARHQFRYWDGETWTEHVSDNGVATTDAL
jgi:hypothetical protein